MKSSHTMLRFAGMVLLIVLVVGWSARDEPVPRQEFRHDDQAEAQFERAVLLFGEGKYEDAVQLFDTLARRMPVHQRTTAALVMEGKSLFRLDRYDQSVAVLESLLARYPYTSYAGEAHYTLGLDHLARRRYDDAGAALLRAMELPDTASRRRAREALGALAAGRYLGAAALERLREKAGGEDAGDFLTWEIVRKYFLEGDSSRAREEAGRRLAAMPPGNVYGDSVRELLRAATAEKREERRGDAAPAGPGRLKIGVLLPLMSGSPGASAGGVARLAREMLDGITYALNEYETERTGIPRGSTEGNPGTAPRVALEVRDTRRDSLLALGAIRELSASQDVVCIVGPLFSNLVAACAPVANHERIPLITPTATADGLAATGPYVFQAHPDFAVRGKVMARYAVRAMGYRTLAVLSSTEPAGAAVADSFLKEAQRLGAHIIAAETFAPDAADIRQQCMSIRRSALHAHPAISFARKPPRSEIDKFVRAGVARARIDSLVSAGATVAVTALLGPRGIRVADSLRIRLSSPETDSEDLTVPVGSIDAIFVAIDDAEEIAMVGTHLNYFNIQARLLGNNEWYDLEQLDAQKQYVNGVVFASDSYADGHDSRYRAFADAFRRAGPSGKEPSKYTLIGYDVLRVLLSPGGPAASAPLGREEIRQTLSRIRGYRGLHGSISLSGSRVNADMQILKYANGEVTKIGESEPDN